MKKKFVYIVSIAVAAVFATALVAQGGPRNDLSADNVDINLESSWSQWDNIWGGSHAMIGLNSGEERTGWLADTYVDGSGKPDMVGNNVWNVYVGHLEFRNNAQFDGDFHSLTLTHASDPAKSSITVEAGATYNATDLIENVRIGTADPGYGTFTVSGGTVSMAGAASSGGLGVNLGGDNSQTTSDGIGIFEVVGSGGSISLDSLGISRISELQFELDSSGNVTPIDITGPLNIYADDVGGGAGGILKVDTSAFATSSGSVDLFNYSSLSGEFGDVQVLGSELSAGNGTDPLTYSLDYGSGTDDTVSLTYNNVPEPSSLFLLGLAGLLLMKRRRV